MKIESPFIALFIFSLVEIETPSYFDGARHHLRTRKLPSTKYFAIRRDWYGWFHAKKAAKATASAKHFRKTSWFSGKLG
jgi:hypothetical protein